MATRTTIIKVEEGFEFTAEAHKCIGYLATWAIQGDSGRYSGMVSIYCRDNNGDILADYRDKEGNLTYSIIGIRADDGSYSTHS